MVNCQQKLLSTLSLGIVFSLSSAVSAKAATVAYNPILLSDNNPPADLVNDPDFGGVFSSYTLGFQFSVNPGTDNNNQEITAFGVYAPPNDFALDPNNAPLNATNAIPNPGPFDDPSFVFLPDTAHDIALWEVDSQGNPLEVDGNGIPIPVRRILLEPMVDDPESDNPEDLIINPLLGFIYDVDDPGNYGFAYLALDDPSDPVTDTELDDILVLDGSEQFFRMGVSYINNRDQAWINDVGFLEGEVNVPNEDLETPPGPGAALDPMVVLQPNLAGGGQPQGYYALQDDPTGDPLLFPGLPNQSLDPDDPDFMPFPGFSPETSPFFAAGNILFGPLPPGFPVATTTGTGGTGTDGTGTGGTGTDGTGTGGTGTGGTGTDGTGTGGTGTGGTPTIPEPSLIHSLLAIALGSVVTRYKQGKGKTQK
ncbi:MAG: histidinol dehydrogenase [Crocosphaera sp.]|nr:histidinol dehydrogenase [Crocosphaera sp.]